MRDLSRSNLHYMRTIATTWLRGAIFQQPVENRRRETSPELGHGFASAGTTAPLAVADYTYDTLSTLLRDLERTGDELAFAVALLHQRAREVARILQ